MVDQKTTVQRMAAVVPATGENPKVSMLPVVMSVEEQVALDVETEIQRNTSDAG